MLPKFNCLTEEQVSQIHNASMHILETIGVEFEYEPALEVFKSEGLKVEGSRVFFTREYIEAQLKKAPAQFTLHARNPEKNIVIGGENIVFMPGYGAPFIHEADGTRRNATLEDFKNFVKLAAASDSMHMTGGTMVEPNDVPDEERHLEMFYASVKYSDKVFMGSASGAERARDCVEMAAILHGGEDVIKEKPCLISLINSVTPLKYDDRMLGALMEYSKAGQAMVIASLVMAGSTGPATIAGALALQNSEVLAGICLTQAINPGTPVVYGSTSAITDMQSGSLSIGTPETGLFITASAQLARFYGVPSRSGGGLTDTKIADAQGGYESMMTLMAAGVSGINYVLHAAGIVQYYMAMSYEKFVIDCEIASMVLRYIRGFEIDEHTLALEVIEKVGPGGHFLTQKHTKKSHKTELRKAVLSDRGSYDAWMKEKLKAEDRAERLWKEILANYEAPALDSQIDEALQKYIASKKN